MIFTKYQFQLWILCMTGELILNFKRHYQTYPQNPAPSPLTFDTQLVDFEFVKSVLFCTESCSVIQCNVREQSRLNLMEITTLNIITITNLI